MDTTKQYKVISTEFIKNGSGAKGPWTLYKAILEGTDIKPSGFAALQPGDMVTVEEKINGEYTNYNYTKVKAGASAAPAPSTQPAVSGGDPRALKLLTVIAEQIGVEKQVILDILAGN